MGFISSGKGTVATQLVNEHNFVQESFASSLKDACSMIFDWPRNLLEGDTAESRAWREVPDLWWSEELGIPNFTPRDALQIVGTNVLRNHFHQDLWFLTVKNRVRKTLGNVVISDVRFRNEIDFIRQNNGILIRINRGELPEWFDIASLANQGNQPAKTIMEEKYADIHPSEWSWAGLEYDFEIDNNGSLEQLSEQLNKVLKEIKQ